MRCLVASIVVLCLSITALVEGQPQLRCRCIRAASSVKPKHIEEVKVLAAGPHCQRVQIIITLKPNKRQVCLDPNSIMGKKLIKQHVP